MWGNREDNAPVDFLFERSALVCADGFAGALCSGKDAVFSVTDAAGSATGTSILDAITPFEPGFKTLYQTFVLLCWIRFFAIGATTTLPRSTLLFLFVREFLMVILDLLIATTTPTSDL